MRVVPQKDSFGCAVASVAARLGLSYQQSRRLFGLADAAPLDAGLTRSEVIAALLRANATGVLRRFGATKPQQRVAAIPVGSIVCVRRWGGDRELHYVVRASSARWLDPLDALQAKKSHWLGPCAKGQVHRTWPRGWVPLSFIEVTTRQERA